MCVCVCVFARACVFQPWQMYVCVCVCVYAHMFQQWQIPLDKRLVCVCVCVCVCVYAHMFQLWQIPLYFSDSAILHIRM